MTSGFAVSPRPRRGFTLFELVLALAILMLISGAVFTLTGAALESAKTAREEQTSSRRLEAFLRVTRDTFHSLDAKGHVFLRMARGETAPTPELVFQGVSGAFGSSSLGESSLVLAALPRADGSRTFAMRRIPGDGDTRNGDAEIPWISLMAGVERVRWTFFAAGAWVEEWQPGQGRPELVRLNFAGRDFPNPVEAIFWLPPLTPLPAATPPAAPSPTAPPSGGPSPAPSPAR